MFAAFAATMIVLSFVGVVVPPIAAQTSTANAKIANARVPRLVTFSGTLKDVHGDAAGSVVGVTFALYTQETGGVPLWQEIQNVQVDETGHYTVLLGATKAEGLPIELFTSKQAQWLGVQPDGQAEQPPIMLLSVPYALKAADAETFGGKPPSAYVVAPQQQNAGGNTNAIATPGATAPNSATAGSSGLQTPKSVPQTSASGGQTNYIPLWTSPSKLGSSVMYQSGTSIGIGTTTPTAPLTVMNSTQLAGIGSTTTVQNSAAVFGGHSLTSGKGFGVEGLSASPQGVGLYGLNTAGSGVAVGVSGNSFSADGVGVFGLALTNKSGGTGVGVEGQSYVADGYGGVFINNAISGEALGLGGATSSQTGIGILGLNRGQSATVSNFLNIPIGILGSTIESKGIGIVGAADDGQGVVGANNDPALAAGSFTNTDTTAAGTGIGVSGTTSSPNGFGVYGVNTASGYGVYGQSDTGVGILGACVPTGSNSCFNGVAGLNTSTSGSANGLWGLTGSPEGTAVYMVNTGGGDLLLGSQSDGGSATFYVQAAGSGYFAGNLDVTGAITAGTKDFKIDHPLDPANKYLVHASVESSEMMNIYTGNITTDGEGVATVQLPEWFEALNRNFRYQLTVMGQFAQAIVADKVANHQFRIKTDKPNVEVSWQVTGVRHDAFANADPLQVEVAKAPSERGHYLHPELYGAPTTARINHHSGRAVAHQILAVPPRPTNALQAQQRPPLKTGKMPLLLPKTPPSPPAIPAMMKVLQSPAQQH